MPANWPGRLRLVFVARSAPRVRRAKRQASSSSNVSPSQSLGRRFGQCQRRDNPRGEGENLERRDSGGASQIGAVSPKRNEPYYINDPIVLKSGQRLYADREAEIRLVPGTNTCMVRNESLISGQSEPIPADVKPDTQITIEGGIWTTLATSQTQSNGNLHGRSARRPEVPSCHGVIILSNIRGAVIRNLVVRQSRAHAVQLSNCREFLVEGVVFDKHRRDGIHVNGPASYGMIRNIRGETGDDFVAINAWDWCNTAPTFGPIHHVLVEAIHGSPQLGGTDEIRLLPGTKTFADGRSSTVQSTTAYFVIFTISERSRSMTSQTWSWVGTKTTAIRSARSEMSISTKLAFNRARRFQVAVHVRRTFDKRCPAKLRYRCAWQERL